MDFRDEDVIPNLFQKIEESKYRSTLYNFLRVYYSFSKRLDMIIP